MNILDRIKNFCCKQKLYTKYENKVHYFISDYYEYTNDKLITTITNINDIDFELPHINRYKCMVFYSKDTHAIYRLTEDINKYELIKYID